MDLSKEKQKQKEFCDILIDLANNQGLLQDTTVRSRMYQRLESLYYGSIYEPEFRHLYSDIFSVITSLKQDNHTGSIEVLLQNLSLIRDGYQAVNHDGHGKIIDISGNIRKLYDHVTLEVERIQYFEREERRTLGKEELKSFQSENNRIKAEVELARNEQKKLKEELSRQQREYIAILGIFAAVVLAFTGGIAFTTSVLNNIHRVSVYRIAIISLIIGLVLINILFGLFYYVDKLVNGESGKRLAPLIVSNVVIIALLAVISVAWWYGCVEKRNDRIDKQNITITQQINPDTQNIPPSSDHAGPSFAVISVKSRQRQVFLS